MRDDGRGADDGGSPAGINSLGASSSPDPAGPLVSLSLFNGGPRRLSERREQGSQAFHEFRLTRFDRAAKANGLELGGFEFLSELHDPDGRERFHG